MSDPDSVNEGPPDELPEETSSSQRVSSEQLDALYAIALPHAMSLVRHGGLSREEATDIAHEVIVMLLRRSSTLPDLLADETRARAYVRAAVRHLINDRRRALLGRKEISLGNADVLDESWASDLSGLDLEAALEALDPEEAILLRRQMEGRSINEIAAELRISEHMAAARMDRAMRHLRSALEGGLVARPKPVRARAADDAFPDPAPPESIEILIEPGDASESDVRDFLRALNDFHVASGGIGLEFRVDGTFVTAKTEVPA